MFALFDWIIINVFPVITVMWLECGIHLEIFFIVF